MSFIKEFWLPDAEILNLKEFKTLDVLSKLEGLWLNRDTEIMYAVATRITFICPMTFNSFPLDVQVCLFQVWKGKGNWKYLSRVVVLFCLWFIRHSFLHFYPFPLYLCWLVLTFWFLMISNKLQSRDCTHWIFKDFSAKDKCVGGCLDSIHFNSNKKFLWLSILFGKVQLVKIIWDINIQKSAYQEHERVR